LNFSINIAGFVCYWIYRNDTGAELMSQWVIGNNGIFLATWIFYYQHWKKSSAKEHDQKSKLVLLP
jgi:uncharacterized membrane protein YeaQ/YmgE (transglycosylase-associated protein family)